MVQVSDWFLCVIPRNGELNVHLDWKHRFLCLGFRQDWNWIDCRLAGTRLSAHAASQSLLAELLWCHGVIMSHGANCQYKRLWDRSWPWLSLKCMGILWKQCMLFFQIPLYRESLTGQVEFLHLLLLFIASWGMQHFGFCRLSAKEKPRNTWESLSYQQGEERPKLPYLDIPLVERVFTGGL